MSPRLFIAGVKNSDELDVIDALPAFPLPNTVLFPGTVLPLHIFEPRYRQMVDETLAGDGVLSIALIRPGNNEAENPILHAVAGCGRIIHSEKLDDGRYNILVQGMERVRLVQELRTDKLYREFRAEVLPRPDREALREAEFQLAKLQSCVLGLRTMLGSEEAPLIEVLRSTSDPLELADILAASLIEDSETQQAVLASEPLAERLEKLIDALAEAMLRLVSSQTPAENELN